MWEYLLVAKTEISVRAVIVACSSLLGFIGIFAGGVWFYKRRIHQDALWGESSNVWSLDELESMRQSGQITGAEFRAMREAIIRVYTEGADSKESGDGLLERDQRLEADLAEGSTAEESASQESVTEESWEWVADETEELRALRRKAENRRGTRRF